jgi:hypothetical protein
MGAFVQHPVCGTLAIHCEDNRFWCPKCREGFSHGPSEDDVKKQIMKQWEASTPKAPAQKSYWNKQPRSSRNLPNHPE